MKGNLLTKVIVAVESVVIEQNTVIKSLICGLLLITNDPLVKVENPFKRHISNDCNGENMNIIVFFQDIVLERQNHTSIYFDSHG